MPATRLSDGIVQHFEPSQTTEGDRKPVTLIRLMKEEVSDKDSFFRLFVPFIEHHLENGSDNTELNFARTLSRLGSFLGWSTEDSDALSGSLVKFAKYLMDNLFLPCMLLRISARPLHTFIAGSPFPCALKRV